MVIPIHCDLLDDPCQNHLFCVNWGGIKLLCPAGDALVLRFKMVSFGFFGFALLLACLKLLSCSLRSNFIFIKHVSQKIGAERALAS